MPNLQNIIPNIPDKNKNSPDPALRQFRDSDVNAIKSSLIKAQQNFEELTGSIPPITEETDHLRTPKPIRESPFAATDVYIKETQLGDGLVKTENVFNVQETLFSSDDFVVVNVNGQDVIFIKGSPNIPSVLEYVGQFTRDKSVNTYTFFASTAQVGDLLLFAGTAGSPEYWTTPPGWTEVFNYDNLTIRGIKVLARIKQEGDPNNFVFEYNPSTINGGGSMLLRFRGASIANIKAGTMPANVSGTTVTLPSVTADIPSISLIMSYFGGAEGPEPNMTIGSPAGYTFIDQSWQTPESYYRGLGIYQKPVEAGATGNAQVNWDVSGNISGLIITVG